MKKRTGYAPAIIRALAKAKGVGMTKVQIVTYLGAQDAWNAVDYDMRVLRTDGQVAYDQNTRRWHIARGDCGA